MKMLKLLLLIILYTSTFHPSSSSDTERRLINKLKADYTKLERPVVDSAQPVEVKLSITLQQIIDLVS
jgi:hypothetical protein